MHFIIVNVFVVGYETQTIKINAAILFSVLQKKIVFYWMNSTFFAMIMNIIKKNRCNKVNNTQYFK